MNQQHPQRLPTEPTDLDTLKKPFRRLIQTTQGKLKMARALNDGLAKEHRCLKTEGVLRGLLCGYAVLHGYTKGKSGPTLWRIGNEIFYREGGSDEGSGTM